MNVISWAHIVTSAHEHRWHVLVCVRTHAPQDNFLRLPLEPDKKMTLWMLHSSYTHRDAHTCKHILADAHTHMCTDAHTQMGMHIYTSKPLL